MAFAAAAIRTAITEVIEGAGPFSYGAFTGMPADALMAKLRQMSTGQHWFDVQITPERTSGSSTVPLGNSTYLMGLDVVITVWTGLATPAQATERDAVLAEIGDDCGDAARALARPGSMLATADDVATSIVGGCFAQPPRWRLLRQNWTASDAHCVHELRGRIDIKARLLLSPLAVLGANLAIEYDPGRSAVLADSDTTIDTLTCQISGHVISAASSTGRPAYTASDADFEDYPSLTSSAAGLDGLRSASAHASDLIASGARPYVAWLGRLPAGSASPSEFVWSLCTASDLVRFCLLRASSASYELQLAVNGTTIDTLDYVPDTSVHLYELIYNASNDLELWVDYARVATVAAAALTSGIRRVSLGQRVDDARHGNGEHAYFIACHSAPHVDHRAALHLFWVSRGAPIADDYTL